MVHANILKNLDARDNESMQVTLNQIHYGSIKASREVNEIKYALKIKEKKTSFREGIRFTKNPNKVNGEHVVKEFVKLFEHLIEPGVFSDALKGEGVISGCWLNTSQNIGHMQCLKSSNGWCSYKFVQKCSSIKEVNQDTFQSQS